MNYSDKITQRNDRLKIVAMLINAVGALALAIGLIYTISIDVLKSPMVSILAVDDIWVRFLGTESIYIAYSGLTLLCLGILFRWRAEDSQTALEKTNRLVAYPK